MSKPSEDQLKQEIRVRVWRRLEESGLALFPKPVHGRIPNFRGAEEAAERLTMLKEYRDAEFVKVNPDSPQKHVRRRVLEDGKVLIFPTPRISQGFILLEPRRIPESNIREAATIAGAFKHGVKTHPKRLPKIDFIVAGSVAVSLDGWRVGKGEGYSEIEYALLRMMGKVDAETPVATTVHEIQVVDHVPRLPFDLPVDVICTNTRTIRCPKNRKPERIYWSFLPEEKIKAIPLLAELREDASSAKA
ncbi:MAG: 5-formyltetrahydrofolate cyclo-ligase [Candidatus Caldarchaeum sp.]|nr:5-formyltetrahydrofolate cyclo-ligase [Candidatus Caldarchaeum sp.]MDW8360360.1 5-formyltetrahydrofolate cyclo-ligase [Candidatus Caldarchaeum sp.]